MLNVGKLAAGGEGYYLATVASGVEDYYVGAGEAAGYWLGAAARDVGVEGEVDAEALRAVLGGRNPASGEPLGSFRSGRTVPGFDLAFRAPKSVSLLWALGSQHTAAEVRAAHDEAVSQALGDLEDHAAYSRRGAGGHESVKITGFVGAAFRHRSSRAGDPLLHTHVLVPNIGQAVDDGLWRTLDARRLYTHAKTAGCLYQAALRAELTARLGVEWTQPTNGLADVAGVPRELIEAFSQRRAEIVAHMADRGESSARAAQAAALATRRAKDYGVDAEGLHERWRSQAGEFGWGQRRIEGLLGATRGERLSPAAIVETHKLMAGAAGLTAKSASFTRRDVVQAWCNRLRHGAPVADVLALAGGMLANDADVAVELLPIVEDIVDNELRGQVDAVVAAAADAAGTASAADVHGSDALRTSIAVSLAATGASAAGVAARLLARELDSAEDPAAVLAWRAQRMASQADPDAAQRAARSQRGAVIRRADGRIVSGDPDERRYSTPGLFALEQRLLTSALERADDRVGIVGDRDVDEALAATPGLSEEQAAMVRRLTTSGAGVEVVVGRAGSGKTHALAAARRAWDTTGTPVIGAALAARAAQQLTDGAGIDAGTLDALLADVAREHARLEPGSVVVIDEAAMVGTRKLGRLLDHAQEVGAKVVLVGDHHQLPEIDAGGLFRGLAHRLPACELTHTRRQRHHWEREALDELRTGSPQSAVAAYHAQGRIHTEDDANAARDKLVADWWTARTASDHESQDDHLMIAARASDVNDLNRRARHRLVAAGALTGEPLQVGERDYQVGDEVICLRNDRRVGVVNGTRGTVTAIDQAQGRLRIRAARGDFDLPGGYLQAGHLAHGYAVTGHKAQGSTCERRFVLGTDELYREWAYTALSRHRDRTDFYLVGQREPEPDAHPQTLQVAGTDALTSLADDLHRSRAQEPAVDHIAIANTGGCHDLRPAPPEPARDDPSETGKMTPIAAAARHARHLVGERDRAVTELARAQQRHAAVQLRLLQAERGLGRLRHRAESSTARRQLVDAADTVERWHDQIARIDRQAVDHPSDRDRAGTGLQWEASSMSAPKADRAERAEQRTAPADELDWALG